MDIPSFKVEFIPKIGLYNLFSPEKEYEEIDLCLISNKNKEFLEFILDKNIGKSFYLEISENDSMSDGKRLINELVDYHISMNVKDYISNSSTKELLLNNPIEININLKYNRTVK